MSYFFTTLLLLLFTLIWSYFLSLSFFYFCIKNHPDKDLKNYSFFIFPSLVLAPCVILFFFHAFHINIMFPVYYDSSVLDIVFYCLQPSLVLLLSSGLAHAIMTNMKINYARWVKSFFVRSGQGFGFSVSSMLKPLLIKKTLLESWIYYFPWIFGEIIVVESIFNIPGIGFSLWQAFRQRDIDQVFYLLFLLGSCYAAFAIIFYANQKKLSRLLQSYS